MRIGLGIGLGLGGGTSIPVAVLSVEPAIGASDGGTDIEVTLTTTSGVTGITIGGTPCTDFVKTGPTTVTCTTPAKAADTYDVAANVGDPLVDGFEYVDVEVEAISPAQGIPGGGIAVTLTLSSTVDVTGITIGGTACTSVIVVDDTTVTCVTPAKSNGTYDVAANVGTELDDGFEVWDPTAENVNGLYRASYGGSPWAGAASAGDSGGRDMSQVGATAPSVGSALPNGQTPADFNGTDDTLNDGTNATLTYISTTAYQVDFLIYIDTVGAAAAGIYDNEGVLTDSGGNFGIVVNDDGADATIHCFHHSTTYKVASKEISTGAWHHVRCVYNGTAITVSVDGVAGTPTTAGTMSAPGANIRLGKNYANAAFFDGKIAEVSIGDVVLSASNAKYELYYEQRYGVSL
jgi:hypothetical protein